MYISYGMFYVQDEAREIQAIGVKLEKIPSASVQSLQEWGLLTPVLHEVCSVEEANGFVAY